MGSSEGPVCTGGGRTRGAAGRSGAYMLCRRSSLPLRSMPPKEIQRSGNYYNTHTILCREKQTNVNQYNQMLINIIHTILCVRYIYACFACARACAVEEINSIHACEWNPVSVWNCSPHLVHACVLTCADVCANDIYILERSSATNWMHTCEWNCSPH